MKRPRNPVELNFEDLTGGGSPTGQVAEIPATQPETGGDLVTSIDSLFERANTTINNIKELISMFKGFNPNPGLGQGAGPAQPYAPQPTLIQQLHRLINIIYSNYGDITVAQMIEGVARQYGNTKLSVVLKALERMQ